MAKYEVFEDVLPLGEQQRLFDILYSSLYRIGWSDRKDTKEYDYLYSMYSRTDVDHIKFFENINNKRLLSLIEDKILSRCIVNLSFSTDTYFPHTHVGHSLVYYPNLIWNQHWEGETFIYEDNGIDVHACIPYKPNRVLWIDPSVPHAIRPPSNAAQQRRFTLAFFFNDDAILQ